jgi:hypothetical protein
MIFAFDLEENESDVLSNARYTMEQLSQALIDSIEPGNNDAVLSPQIQSLIMALNGYIGMLKETLINPLDENVSRVRAQLDSLKNFVKAAESTINKAQRATSQLTAMFKR